MDKHHILMINITSSPGAGKTSLIMQTIDRLKGKARMAVIEGDIASSIDADKVSRAGYPGHSDQHGRRLPPGCQHDQEGPG